MTDKQQIDHHLRLMAAYFDLDPKKVDFYIRQRELSKPLATKSFKYEDVVKNRVFEEFGPEHTKANEANARRIPKELNDRIIAFLTGKNPDIAREFQQEFIPE